MTEELLLRAMRTGAAKAHCFTEGPTAHDAAWIARDQRKHPPTSTQIVAACEIGLPRMLPEILE